MAKAYKKIEIVGISNESFSNAVDNAIDRANDSVRGLAWFEVDELRGKITDGKIDEYQVTVKIGFQIEKEGA